MPNLLDGIFSTWKNQPPPRKGARPGYKVKGSRFRIQGSGFRMQGSRFRVQGPWSRVQGPGSRVQGSGFRFEGWTMQLRPSGFSCPRCCCTADASCVERESVCLKRKTERERASERERERDRDRESALPREEGGRKRGRERGRESDRESESERGLQLPAVLLHRRYILLRHIRKSGYFST